MSVPQHKELLSVENLRVIFRQGEGQETVAVDGISFFLQRGKTLGIVGESGSGKSVTALSILQLLSDNKAAISSGEVFYFNRNKEKIGLHNLSEKALNQYRGHRIAMIFQEPKSSLNPVFKIGAQISEALMLHTNIKAKEAKTITLEWLEKVKLPATDRIYDSYPHQLSGGQLQRVMIAMAMSCQPDLLIADEPTTGLDVTVQQSILQLMYDLQKETKTAIFFISHDLGVIKEVADEVIVMQKGKIVERGTVNDVFHAPEHPYTRGLIACRPPMDKRLRRLPVIEDFVNAKDKLLNTDQYPIELPVKKDSPLLLSSGHKTSKCILAPGVDSRVKISA